MINPPDSQNINQSQIQSNQFASQVNDPELFTTMQEILKRKNEKVILEEKKEEIEEEADKEAEDKNVPKTGGLTKSMIQRRINFKKVNEEFKNIFNKENSNINDCRRCLIHIIIFVGVLNCCAWEVDCLFFNICYGEDIEMRRWISICLFPIIILSIFLLYILFDSINYLKKKIIMTCIIIYLIVSIFSIVLGIVSLADGSRYNEDNASSTINELSVNEREYYKELSGNGDENEGLRKQYRIKMVVSGVIDLILGLAGILVFAFTVCFTSLLSKTSFDWRPPLRSHIRPPRVKKAIQLYTQNYDSYLNMFRAENPNYQIDEKEAKETKDKFGGIRGSVFGKFGDSVRKPKKETEKSEKSENEDSFIKKLRKQKKDKSEKSSENNKEDELPVPTIKKKKRGLLNRIDKVDNKDKEKDEDNKKSEGENNHINNRVENNHVENNHVDNNHVENNHIENNHVNNHINIEEINTDIKDKDNKDEI